MDQKVELVWYPTEFQDDHQQNLKNTSQNSSFTQQFEEALKIVRELQKDGSQISQKQQNLKMNIIGFGEDTQTNQKQFLENHDLLVLTESNVSKLQYYVNQIIDFLNAIESIKLSFFAQVKGIRSYYHQVEETGFRFLLINQQLQQNYQLSESQLDEEIIKLTSQSDLNELKSSVLQKEEMKKNKKGHGFSIFEKLIYYYSRQELYNKLNQQMAESDYESIKQIMCTLFDGYSKLNYQKKPPKKLYRGFSLHPCFRDIYLKIVRDLMFCHQNKSSMFWNTLASTSLEPKVVDKFLQQNLKIVFEIQLSENNPHPYFKLKKYHAQYDEEKEVILFPQFQFEVIEYRKCESGIDYFCIKQIENNLSMTFDKKKREKYWQDRINNELKPKLKIINEFYQTRINFIIKGVRKFAPQVGDIRYFLKQNLDAYFFQLVQYLQQFFQNQETHKEYLDNLLDVCIKEISFEFIISDDFLVKLSDFISRVSEQLINQFIKIIQKIFNLEDFKGDLIMIWSEFYPYTINSLFNYRLDCIYSNTPNYTTRQLNWRKLQQQEVKTIQIVQHSESQKMGYELTIDGNKVLVYQTDDGVPTIVKQKDTTKQLGYTDKWKTQGKRLQTKDLTVKDVQQGLKADLKNNNYNLTNFEKYKVKITEQQSRQLGQVGVILGGMLVDAYYGKLDKDQLIQTGIQTASIFLSQSIQLGLLVFQLGKALVTDWKKFLSKSNIQAMVKQYFQHMSITQLSLFIGNSVGTFYGPFGCASGQLMGGIIGGAAAKLIHMKTLNKKFKLKITFGQNNKGIQNNGLLIHRGVNPKVQFSKVDKNQVKSLIIYAVSDYRILWLAINIPNDQITIEENDRLGMLSLRFPYMGPFDHESKIAFYAFGVNDQNLNENNVFEDINNNKLTIVSSACKQIINKTK
ncbi:unnamed protein product (macronuclear) [Paramecium tetraurelia]|uniref:Uncharacterized protein n=1 Tax=Paramecium tetraurelia TaxID=5888 RepID=A0CFY8_PARTE|nr:uncharacterized protein GSPATT00038147001 [Paramecium tetraurelia]CAK69705.1 unnamed protein product [Paramecium tetraurelia]|eukprot:XP_001437102.1 hypothetical protein (macronuclear) [Paramecium tetraurelia strain d4-2]